MSSIIIPAHNEASLISKTLSSLLNQVDNDDEIIVVANGCTDNTYDAANKFISSIKLISTETPSKTNALNLGDSKATSFPRVYMDADIQLVEGALTKIIDALLEGKLLAISPIPKMDFSNSSWFVKAYYDIWLSLPYCRSGMMGAGVYALSEEGRDRFDIFPDIIADDGYVRALFKEDERGNVKGAYAIVKAPTTLNWLLKIKIRSRLGQMELAQKYPELLKNEEKSYGGALSSLLKKPHKWLKLAIYIFINIITRIYAKKNLKNMSDYQWEKDMSSRNKKE